MFANCRKHSRYQLEDKGIYQFSQTFARGRQCGNIRQCCACTKLMKLIDLMTTDRKSTRNKTSNSDGNDKFNYNSTATVAHLDKTLG